MFCRQAAGICRIIHCWKRWKNRTSRFFLKEDSATIEEWLLAAEYIMYGGSKKIILCERGIRTFEPYTRDTFDISAIPLIKELSHLPVIADTSYATGKSPLVPPVARAAIAAGADGLIVKVHPNPSRALSDGPQSLTPDRFYRLYREI